MFKPIQRKSNYSFELDRIENKVSHPRIKMAPKVRLFIRRDHVNKKEERDEVPIMASIEAPPEKGSLRESIVKRRWNHLWTPPIAWHDGHLRILDCPTPQLTSASYIDSKTEDLLYLQGISSLYPSELVKLHSTLTQVQHDIYARTLLIREVIRRVILEERNILDMRHSIRMVNGG